MSLTLWLPIIAEQLKTRQWKLAVAESCTGGGLAYQLTSLPGSSAWFERGFVTYSNEAKMNLLGVGEETLHIHGAVSELTAREMAEGVLLHSPVDLSVSVTGIAGPDGGNADKPVGLVWFAWAGKNVSTVTAEHKFEGDRQMIREQAVACALQGLAQILSNSLS